MFDRNHLEYPKISIYQISPGSIMGYKLINLNFITQLSIPRLNPQNPYYTKLLNKLRLVNIKFEADKFLTNNRLYFYFDHFHTHFLTYYTLLAIPQYLKLCELLTLVLKLTQHTLGGLFQAFNL